MQPETIKLGYFAETPKVAASGQFVVNRNPFPVIITIKDAGSVKSWTIKDTFGKADTINAPLHAGQMVTLYPAESISFNYGKNPPGWSWRTVQ